MAVSGHISASAFLVNASRARNVALSRDLFAHLWVTDEVRRLWEEFSHEVYPFDDIELGLRNRYFLERLERTVRGGPPADAKGRDVVFVNLAAGYTSYPFLLDEVIPCIEVDYPHVVRSKQNQIARWEREGLLPARQISYLGADLASRQEMAALETELATRIAERTSFCLMEGLTYYLGRDDLQRLFDTCRRLQSPGSILAFDYWVPASAEHPVLRRFARFCAKRFGRPERAYNLLDATFIDGLPGYRVSELITIQELARGHGQTALLQDEQQILPESYAVLERSTC